MNGDLGEVLEDAERYQRLFVAPMVEALKAEMKTHLGPLAAQQEQMQTKVDAHETAINELRGSQKKALLGWGVYASAGAVVIGSAWGWVKTKFHWG